MMASAREVLLGSDDVQTQAELLLSHVVAATTGSDSPGVSELFKLCFAAGGPRHAGLKKLAYDLCRLAPVGSGDAAVILQGIKADLASGAPELAALALEYLPSLPPAQLVEFVQQGDVMQMVEPLLRSPSGSARAAAIQALVALLLQPHVLDATAASPHLTDTAQELWDAVSDSLLDDDDAAAHAAVVATGQLLAAANAADPQLPGSYLLGKLADALVQRCMAALGPVLETIGALQAQSQPPVCRLLAHMVRRLHGLQHHTHGSAAARAASKRSSAALQPPGHQLNVLAPAACSILLPLLSSLDAATVLEACKALLAVAAHAGTSSSAPGGLCTAPAVPKTLADTAVGVLVGLYDRLLVEPALYELVVTVVGALPLLEPADALQRLQQLVPLIGRLQAMQQRLAAFCATWRTWLQLLLRSKEAPPAAAAPGTLPWILEDISLREVLSGSNLARSPPMPGLTNGGSAFGAAPGAAGGSAGVADARRSSTVLRASSARGAKPADEATAGAGSAGAAGPPSSLRLELVCSLLEVLRRDAAAVMAAEAAAAQAAAGGAPPRHLRAELLPLVHWCCASAMVLKATTVCLAWPALPLGPLDSTTVAVDSWLQLLAACVCGLGCAAALLRQHQLSGAMQAAAEEAVAEHKSDLQALLRETMDRWSQFAPAVKPRLLWAMAACYKLPFEPNQDWHALLACMEDVLLHNRAGAGDGAAAGGGGGNNGRAAEAAALEGFMSAASSGGGVSAEAVELRCLADASALMVAQQLAGLLANRLAAAGAKGGSGSGGTATAALQGAVSIAAMRLGSALQKYSAMSGGSAASPDTREWCRRLLKTLSPLLSRDGVEGVPTAPKPLPSLMLLPGAAAGAMAGYPFSAPSTAAMYHSRSSQRQRAFLRVLHIALRDTQGAAVAAAEAMNQQPPAATAAPAGSLLSGSSALRLDNPDFWEQLPQEGGSGGRWQQLSGASDPVALRACVRLGGSGGSSDAGHMWAHLQLRATNRCGQEVPQSQLFLAVSGPARLERTASVWQLPALDSGESCSYGCSVQLLGYGAVRVQCVLLVPGAGEVKLLQHSYRPLPLGFIALLRPPVLPASAGEFAALWAQLPCWQQLAAPCRWPGLGGQLALLSAALTSSRASLQCVHMACQPACGSCQASFLGETPAGEAVALQVTSHGLPLAAAAAGLPSGCALAHVEVRTSCPAVAAAVAAHADEWLQELSTGALLSGPQATASAAAVLPPPVLHPAVAALHKRATAGPSGADMARAGAGATAAAPATSEEQPAKAVVSVDLLDDGPVGGAAGDVSDSWARGAALAEWKRLRGIPS